MSNVVKAIRTAAQVIGRIFGAVKQGAERALTSVGFSPEAARQIVGAVQGAIAAAGVRSALNAFAPGAESYDPYATQRVSFSSSPPQVFVFGTFKVGGNIVYGLRVDTPLKYDYYVVAIGFTRHNDLAGIWIDEERLDLNGSGNGPYTVTGSVYSNAFALWFYNGDEVQTALSELTGAAGTQWTVNHKGNNICYAVLRWKRDEAVYTNNGVPFNRTSFEVRGVSHYDPRKDDTITGGSGSHRIDDPSTWEYSSNPAIHWFTYQRGVWVNGLCVLGRGLYSGSGPVPSVVSDMVPSVMAAADVCDEPVNVSGGGMIPRYESHGVITGRLNHSGNESIFLNAMAGFAANSGGKREVFAGKDDPVIDTITDLFAYDPPSVGQLISSSSLVANRVQASYTERAEGWVRADIPPYDNAQWQIDDEGVKEKRLSLPSVVDYRQAERLAKIHAMRSRYGMTFSFTRPFEDSQYTPGKRVHVTCPELGLYNEVFRISSRRLQPDKAGSSENSYEMDVFWSIEVKHEPDQVYAWDHSVDEVLRETRGVYVGAGKIQLGAPSGSASGYEVTYTDIDSNSDTLHYSSPAGSGTVANPVNGGLFIADAYNSNPYTLELWVSSNNPNYRDSPHTYVYIQGGLPQ